MATAVGEKAGKPVSYSQFACVGTGFSAIGLGATLKRWYGIDDIVFFERHTELGGTWFANKYPGNCSPYYRAPPPLIEYTDPTRAAIRQCSLQASLY